MSNDKALELFDENTAVQVAATPADLLKIAVSQNADLDKLEKLMELQERWENREAGKAYVKAMSDFHAVSPVVIQDKTNKQYGSKYVSSGNLVNTVNPVLSKFGLSCHWDIDQSTPSLIAVSCVLTHELGHSESVTMCAPPDGSGSKNPIQQIKSTITYLKIVTFESVTGLASSDANLDDDGKAAGTQIITGNQARDLQAVLEESDSVDKFLKAYQIEKLEDLPADMYGKAIKAAEEKRKK